MTVKDFDKAYKERGAYHAHAKGFDAWFLEENYSKIADFCTEGQTILDIGCGEGRLSDFIKPRILRWRGLSAIGARSKQKDLWTKIQAPHSSPSQGFGQLRSPGRIL